MECYFPIDKIEKGSLVSIWGCGELGKYLIEWNKRFEYCNIVCMFEQNKEINCSEDIEIVRIEEWSNYYFDIITMTHNLSEIKKQLLAKGVPMNKCVFLAEGNYINYDMSSQKSYSQEGEDIIIRNLLKRLGRKEISFCDIGANDPYYLNNTYLLERTFNIKRGVLIEPNPQLARKISKERTQDICINCGITDNTNKKKLKFYIMNADTLSSFSREEIDAYKEQGYIVVREEEIDCVNINDILAEYFEDGVDVVSIDTEGFDLKIIEAIDYEKCRPTIFCIETCGFYTGKDKDGLRIISSLVQKGYIVYADTFLNTIFVDKKIMEEDFSKDMKTIYPFIID